MRKIRMAQITGDDASKIIADCLEKEQKARLERILHTLERY
jgi:hypothetical protein